MARSRAPAPATVNGKKPAAPASGIANSEVVVFDHLSHGGLHEDAETFNRTTLDFLLRL